MTVSLTADIQVPTADLRAALEAVAPHRSKVKTGDDMTERLIRLTFAEGWLFVTASNGSTTAMAKIRIDEEDDSRLTLGKLDRDDGPMIVDLEAYRVAQMLQLFKLGGNEDDTVQKVGVHVSADPKDRFVRFVALAGVREGDTLEFQLEAPAEMPDVIAITARAKANQDADTAAKPLVADVDMLKLFVAAGHAYGQKPEIKSTGTKDSGGFIVNVGPAFVGTIESHHGLDGMDKRNQWHQQWLIDVPALKLVSA